MAAGKINGMTTSNIRIDILVDDDPNYDCAKTADDVVSILRHLANRFEQGYNPMDSDEYPVPGAKVDYH